jgi:hypothetical protein
MLERRHTTQLFIAIVAAALSSGCLSSDLIRCSADVHCNFGERCNNHICESDGTFVGNFLVCPTDLQPTFADIDTKILKVSCGTGSDTCHSPAGAKDSGALDLQTDAYKALLGAGGTGEPSINPEGSEKSLLRVKPADPDNSLLFIKMRLKSLTDPRYGAGMPFTQPGSVCPTTLEALKTWITNGAKKD